MYQMYTAHTNQMKPLNRVQKSAKLHLRAHLRIVWSRISMSSVRIVTSSHTHTSTEVSRRQHPWSKEGEDEEERVS